MREVTIKGSDKRPVIVEFLFAEFDGVDRNIDPQLRHGILGDSEVESVFILSFRVPDDPVNDDGSGEVVVDDAAVDYSFAEFLDAEVGREVREKAVDPGSDGLT